MASLGLAETTPKTLGVPIWLGGRLKPPAPTRPKRTKKMGIRFGQTGVAQGSWE
jgi:hypothetical protein